MNKSYLYIFLSSLCLAFLGIFIKLIENVNQMTLNFYRVFFGFLFLLIVIPIFDKSSLKIKKRDIKTYLLIGLIFAISTSLTNLAYKYSYVSNVALITSFAPFFILIFAFFILKEKITKTKIITLIIAIVGLFILNPLRADGFLGNIFALIVAILHALFIVLLRKERINHGVGDLLWIFLFASIFLLPLPFIYGFSKINIYVILIGVISTGLVYFLYNLSLKKIESEIASLINRIFMPLFSIILSIIILFEKPNLEVIIGGIILIIGGIYLTIHLKNSK